MKIEDIKEVGFYIKKDDTEREIIYEIYKDEEEYLVDLYYYDYTDIDDRKHYSVDGCLYYTDSYEFYDIEVEKSKIKYKHIDNSFYFPKTFLIEDKPTYREIVEKIRKICEKESTKSISVNGVEIKDTQKLAIKILKIIQKQD